MNYTRQVGLVFALALGASFIGGPGAHAASANKQGWTKPTPAMVDSQAAVKSADVQWAQIKLKRLGYYHAAVDGKGGPKTIAAIMKFQKKNGLKQTGWLDQGTWGALYRQPMATKTAGAMK